MSRILPFGRGLLEHLELTLTNETFQIVSLDYYLPIEQKKAFGKRTSHQFLAIFVKDV